MLEDFPESYAEAVERLCRTGAQHGWTVGSYMHPLSDELQTTVLRFGPMEAERTLVISSGLHGVEGFLGSAIQLRFVKNLTDQLSKLNGRSVLLVHAINPFGFQCIRRVDPENIDLNRNFHLRDEPFQGADPRYRQLDHFLNPKKWPVREIPFPLQAAYQVLRQGMAALQQAIAEGQYEFPHGLFFGGEQQSPAAKLLCMKLESELQSGGQVLHLDLHTGLGKPKTAQLLLDHQPDEREQKAIQSLFPGEWKVPGSGSGYVVRGSLYRWFHQHIPDSISLCYEFGTHSAIQVLAALRAENAAYHWGDRSSRSFENAKSRLKEAFCPKSERWRRFAIEHSDDLMNRVVRDWLKQGR